jgi:hypothetical protein
MLGIGWFIESCIEEWLLEFVLEIVLIYGGGNLITIYDAVREDPKI